MNGIETLNEWAFVWYAFMREKSIESVIVFLFVGLIWIAMRRWSSPQFGCWLFLLVLIKLALPIHLNAPAWFSSFTISSAVSHVTKTSFPSSIFALSDQVILSEEDKREAYSISPVKIHSDAPSISSSISVQSSPQAGRKLNVSFLAWVMMGWVFIVTAILTKYIQAEWKMHRLQREGKPMTASEIPVNLEELKQRMRVKCAIRCIESPEVPTPVVTGILHPVLIFPSRFFEQFSSSQLHWTILHELAHIRRLDTLIIFFQKIAQIFFFFNPFIWASNWMIDQEREYACDDMALAASDSTRLDCGRGFLTLAKRLNSTTRITSKALGLFTYKTHIRRRMMRILDSKRTLKTRLSWKTLFILFVIACLVLPTVRVIGNAASNTDAKITENPSQSNKNQEEKTDDARSAITNNDKPQELLIRKINRSGPIQEDKKYSVSSDDHGIHIHNHADGTTRTFNNLGNGSSGQVNDMSMSPNSSYIVYNWGNHDNQRNEFHLLNTLAHENHLLVSEDHVLGIMPFDWTRDSKYCIALQITDYDDNWDFENRNYRIILISVIDGSVTQRIDLGENAIFKMFFSPDGRYIIYDSTKGVDAEPINIYSAKNHDIFLYDTKNQTEAILVKHPAEDTLLALSPDGQWLIFQSNRFGTTDIFLQKLGKGAPKGFPKRIRKNVGDSMWSNGITPDGKLYYGVRNFGAIQIYSAGFNDQEGIIENTFQLVGNQLNEERLSWPVWSKHGRSIAFTTIEKLGELDRIVYVYDLETGGVESIYEKIIGARNLCWSFDNQYIYFSSGNRLRQKQTICQLNVQKKKLETLVEVDENFAYTSINASPDKDILYYTKLDPRSDKISIVKHDFKTNQITEIASNPTISIRHTSLSSDGQWIAYGMGNPMGLTQLSNSLFMGQGVEANSLHRISTKTGESLEIIHLDQDNSYPIEWFDWMPDNQTLIYSTRENNKTTFWKISLGKETPIKLCEIDRRIRAFDIHPNGKQIVFELGERFVFESWVMENFIPQE